MENNFDCCRRLVGEIDIVLLLPSVQLYQGIGWLSGEMSNFEYVCHGLDVFSSLAQVGSLGPGLALSKGVGKGVYRKGPVCTFTIGTQVSRKEG
jgi:hypothetical protein